MSNDNFCDANGGGDAVLSNPQIITAPHNWSVAPPQSFTVPDNLNEYQVFNAASTSGTTSYEVKYDVSCAKGQVGTIDLKGKVPDSYTSSNSFSCNAAVTRGECNGSAGTGFHAQGNAQLWGDGSGSSVEVEPTEPEPPR